VSEQRTRNEQPLHFIPAENCPTISGPASASPTTSNASPTRVAVSRGDKRRSAANSSRFCCAESRQYRLRSFASTEAMTVRTFAACSRHRSRRRWLCHDPER
jgi:hypothetical protein